MNTNQNHIGWSFWLQWAIATTVGFIIGGAITGALVMAAEIRFASVTSPWTGAIALAIANAVAFGLFGTALGSAQWFVLRHAIAQLSSWVLATASGWATAGIVSGIIGGSFGGALTGGGPDYGNTGRIMAYVSGFASLTLPGFVQWLALRKQIQQSGWWMPAQCLSILAGTAAAFPVMLVVGRASGWNFPSAQAWGFAGVLAGLIYGAITGAVMIRLLQQPKSFSSARTALQDA